MEFLPDLQLGWLNGWIPIVAFYVLFGLLMALFPKDIVAKLYAVSGWTRKQRLLSLAGKPFALAGLGLDIFLPLKTGQPIFWIGGVIFLLGLAGITTALLNFRNTPASQPIERGLYRISRNPQVLGLVVIQVGVSIMVGSWLAIVCMLIAIAFYHFRILGEERACLAEYGTPYQEYLDRVPRYFGFLRH